jgi:hypothetical protein
MKPTPPVLFQWNGESMTPLARFSRIADGKFVVGQTYKMEAVDIRSLPSLNHYFAELHEIWLNLPEDAAKKFPTADHMRKFALIRTGWRKERSITLRDAGEAARVAAFATPSDEFSIVLVHESTVTIYEAKSQSFKEMGKPDFQKSKSDVLNYLSKWIGASREQISSNAGSSA